MDKDSCLDGSLKTTPPRRSRRQGAAIARPESRYGFHPESLVQQGGSFKMTPPMVKRRPGAPPPSVLAGMPARAFVQSVNSLLHAHGSGPQPQQLIRGGAGAAPPRMMPLPYLCLCCAHHPPLCSPITSSSLGGSSTTTRAPPAPPPALHCRGHLPAFPCRRYVSRRLGLAAQHPRMPLASPVLFHFL